MQNITARDVLPAGTLVRVRPDYCELLYIRKNTGTVVSQQQQELNKLSSMIIESKFHVLIDDGIHTFYWYELQVFDDEV